MPRQNNPVKYYKGQPLPPWMYQGKCIDCLQNLPSEAEGSVGFVYVIWNRDRDKRYIGKKMLLTRAGQHTNWLAYVGGSKLLQQHIAEGERIQRYMMSFEKNKTRLAYAELKLQIDSEALLRDDYYNSYIGGRLHKRGM